jgi:hypothetical protein
MNKAAVQILAALDVQIAALVSTRNIVALLLEVQEPETVPVEDGECKHLNKIDCATMGNSTGWLCQDCGFNPDESS